MALNELPYPATTALESRQRAALATDLRRVATAARERAGVLYDACDGRAALAIHELAAFAALVQRRAEAYERN